MTTRAPTLGRGCRAQRGGVGFLFCGEAASSLPSQGERRCVEKSGILVSQPSPLGKGDRATVDRVLSQTAHLRRSPPLFFIPLEPYPARSARHLPHAGKVVMRKYRFPPSNLRPFGAPPSIGRREYPRKPLPLEGAAERSEAGLAFFFGRRSGALVNDALETISPALFHTARTLSGSLRSPPSPRGEGVVSRKAVSSFRSLPHRERGTAQRWIGYSRISST